MRLPFRRLSSSVSRSLGTWLTLLLLFVVVIPSFGLLWFLNQAVQTEQLAVRQKLTEAYRAQLSDAQKRLEEAWTNTMRRLEDDRAALPPSQLFYNVLTSDGGDAAVQFDDTGRSTYPDTGETKFVPRPDPVWRNAEAREVTDPAGAASLYAQLATTDDADLAARALQAQARCLARAGDRAAALALIHGTLQQENLRGATDLQGRNVVANAALFALEMARDLDAEKLSFVRERLRALALDYEHVSMPSTQRRFVLRELQRQAPDPAVTSHLAAEELAVAYLAAPSGQPRDSALRPSSLPGVWQYAVGDGQLVILHRTENLAPRLARFATMSGLPNDVRLEFFPPGRDGKDTLLSVPAGSAFPGWRAALSITDPGALAAATSKRITLYRSIVALVVIAVLLLALIAGGLVRRQIALTQLRNDLVANVTHELKTPLASMRLLVETLLNTPQLNEQTTREYLQLIATENLRLSRLIGNFLTFSRIERNKYTFHFNNVSPATIVTQTAAAVQDRMPAPGCRFALEVAPELPPVSADVDALVTALVNLLDNAWKYSGDEKQIALTASAQNGSVKFAVRDNGIGLAPRDTKRIFHRFVQVHPTQSTGGGGAGLGLSIVQSIVDAHRGTVRVDSAPGAGSTFTITLPVAEETT